MNKFEYKGLSKDENLQLIYEVARLFVEERKNDKIIKGIYKWAKNNAKGCYNENGEENIYHQWIRRYIEKAAEKGFLVLGEFKE